LGSQIQTPQKTMPLRVFKKRVAVIPIADPEKIGRFWIPDIARERTDQGIVKYVSPDCDPAIKVGSYVIFSGYSGTAFKLESEDGKTVERVILLPERHIFAIVEDYGDVDVSGLYFRDREGQYWTATYDMALELIAQALYEGSKQLKITTPRPKLEEYDDAVD
jgi:co-chaperonin GroES (HSP10)